MYSAAPPAPPSPGRPRLPVAPIVVGAALALAAAVLGLLGWARPQWSPSSRWMISDLPGPLAIVVVASALVCVMLAVALAARAAGLRAGDPVTWAWVGLLLIAAAALVWNALYAAALSTIDFGAPIPIFGWLFTFTPAVLAGWLFMRRDRRARWAAAMGTGVVTVPLLALSCSLLGKDTPVVGGLAATLMVTAVLGVAPLIGGVAIAGAIGGPDPT